LITFHWLATILVLSLEQPRSNRPDRKTSANRILTHLFLEAQYSVLSTSLWAC